MAGFESAGGGDVSVDVLWSAAGDILYATADDAGTVLTIGDTNAVLQVSGGVPAWTTSPTIGSTSWANATHAHAADNSGSVIALGTATSGNYVATVADLGAGGIAVAGSGVEGGTVTVQLDISGLTTDTIAAADFLAFSDEDEANDVTNKLTVVNLMETGLPLITQDTVAVGTDFMVFLDGGATGNANKESIADFVSGIAGTNLTASGGQLSASAGGKNVGFILALS